MRKAAAFLLALFLGIAGTAAQDREPEKYPGLDERLSQYFSLMEMESADFKSEECDALILAATDSALRQAIALKIYDHYRNSPLMGDEAVAIHISDAWFSSGLIPMRSDEELFAARFFADVNRRSLIGNEAPGTVLLDPSGNTVTLGGSGARFRILYFYDTECAKCKLETAALRSLLDKNDYPVGLYAVYVGTDEVSWKLWRDTILKPEASQTGVVHLWDPSSEADLQFDYGVVQTPRMFLIDPEGTIIGRNLDSDALGRILDVVLDAGYDYGSSASTTFLDRLFSTYDPPVKASDVKEVASLLRARTLEEGDTLSFKHVEGDLLYYLAGRKEEGFREGCSAFIDEYVLGHPEIWKTEEDSLMVVGLADMLKGLLDRTPVGSRIPRMHLKGWNRLRRKGGLLFFHSEGCPVCEEGLALADSLGLRYLAVDMDATGKASPEISRRLLDTFDLSSLPYIMEIGKGGVVRRRYITLDGLLSYFDEKE